MAKKEIKIHQKGQQARLYKPHRLESNTSRFGNRQVHKMKQSSKS